MLKFLYSFACWKSRSRNATNESTNERHGRQEDILSYTNKIITGTILDEQSNYTKSSNLTCQRLDEKKKVSPSGIEKIDVDYEYEVSHLCEQLDNINTSMISFADSNMAVVNNAPYGRFDLDFDASSLDKSTSSINQIYSDGTNALTTDTDSQERTMLETIAKKEAQINLKTNLEAFDEDDVVLKTRIGKYAQLEYSTIEDFNARKPNLAN